VVNSNKTILFKPEYSKTLLSIAIGDLSTAKTLLSANDPGRVENILYMIQQSVEKSLKAVLVYKQIAFPLVHDLGILIALLPADEYPPGGFDWTAQKGRFRKLGSPFERGVKKQDLALLEIDIIY
jgi:hypothetical protein